MTASSPFTRSWNPYRAPDAPLHWHKPQTVRVTCDLWAFNETSREEGVLLGWSDLDRIFAVMALCPQHTFYVATARPERMREYLGSEDVAEGIGYTAYALWEDSGVKADGSIASALIKGGAACALQPASSPWPLPNVVLATVVRSQEDADTRIPELLECPAAYRAVFLEPRERLNIEYYLPRKLETCQDCGADDGERDHYGRHAYCGGEFDPQGSTEGIDWLHIAGGREPLDLAWVRSLIAQADAAGVPVWVERLGDRPIGDWYPDGPGRPLYSADGHYRLRSRSGSDPSEWPADLRRRERLEVH